MNKYFLFGITMTMMLLACMPASAAAIETLCIFGNANEDDTINMEDVEYTVNAFAEIKRKLKNKEYNDEFQTKVVE